MLAKLKGWKTVLFNVVMGGLMFVRAISPESELPDEATVTSTLNQFDAALTGLWAVGNVILRAVTNSPIFKKPQE